MWLYLTKVIVSAALIVAISEVAKLSAKWSTFVGGLLASLPLISFLAFVWIYIESRDVEKVSALATSIFWLVLPSLALFIALPPLLLRAKLPFALALAIATVIMFACYGVMVLVLSRLEIKL